MKILPTVILVTICLILESFSQSSEKWKRIEADDLSISIPPAFLVDAEKRNSKTHRIFAFQKGLSVEFEVSKPSDPKNRLGFLQYDKNYTNTSSKKGNFEMVRMSSNLKIEEKIYLASKKYFYYIKIMGSKDALEKAQRILVSIKADGEPLFVQNNPNKNSVYDEEPIKLNEMKTSSEVSEISNQKYEKIPVNVVNKTLKDFQDDIDIAELSRPPFMIDRTTPNFRPGFDSARGGDFFVKMRMTFLANGKVGDIVTYSDSNAAFVSSCVEAARKIKFLPALKDGKAVDSLFIFEYRLMSMTVSSPGIRPF